MHMNLLIEMCRMTNLTSRANVTSAEVEPQVFRDTSLIAAPLCWVAGDEPVGWLLLEACSVLAYAPLLFPICDLIL